jgi:hypothetical protein
MGQINRCSRKHGFRHLANSPEEAATACQKDAGSEKVLGNYFLDALVENGKKFLKAGLDDHIEHLALDILARKALVIF